jgi:short-subunit dehydrogenase
MAKVLILGATSNIAIHVARLMAKRGDRLYLLARNREALRNLVDELGGSVLGSAPFDARLENASADAILEAWALAQGFDIVLIAYGWLGEQVRAEGDLQHAKDIIELNYVSVVMALVTLQGLLAHQGHGHLAFLSTVAAERGRPRNFTYGSAKAGVNVYLEGMRAVLWPRVRVQVFALGPVDTPMTHSHPKNFSFARPENVAVSILRALNRRRFKVFIPGWWRVVMWIVRGLPMPIFRRLRFLSAR